MKITISKLYTLHEYPGLYQHIFLELGETTYHSSCVITEEELKSLSNESVEAVMRFYNEKLKGAVLSLNDLLEKQAVEKSNIK